MYAPFGGFGASGSSFGIGVPVNPAGRSRTVVAGLKRNAPVAFAAAAVWRSGVMSSMTQKLRPWVPRTRSFW